MNLLLAVLGPAWSVEGPDRSRPPPVGDVSWIELAEPEMHRVRDGLTVWMVPVEGFRKVEISVVLQKGQIELAGGPSPVLEAMGALQSVATADLRPAELEEQQALHDVTLGSGVGSHAGAVRVSAPVEELRRAIDLLRQVLFTPAYPRREVELWKRETLLALQVTGPADPWTASDAAMTFAWYPRDHPYGRRPDPREVKGVRAGGLRDAHARWLAESPVTLVVVGDLAWSELEPLLRPVLAHLGAPAEPGRPLEVSPPESRVIAVEFPGQEQVALRLRLPAPAARHADREAFELAAFALGGHFLSRLNANLREEKGYTYGVGAQYIPARNQGTYEISVEVGVDDAAEAIAEIRGEIDRLARDGITDEEREMALRSTAFEWGDTRRDAGSTMGFYTARLRAEETVGDALARNRRVAALGLEEVRRAASAWLGPEAPRVWVLTGDRSRLTPELAAMGWTIEWVDPQAAVWGDL